MLMACSDDLAPEQNSSAPDMQNKAIQFKTGLRSNLASTRATFSSMADMMNELSKYKRMTEEYKLKVTMYKKDADNNPVELESAFYIPNLNPDIKDGELSFVVEDGNSALYWPDNVIQYGFKAQAHNEAVPTDQSTEEAIFSADYIEGYSFEPVLADDIDAINYRTSKEWYTTNKTVWNDEEQQIVDSLKGIITSADLMKVPLFLKHKRNWITVKLKAGKGVAPEGLQQANANNLLATIYSYGADDTITEVTQPMRSFITLDEKETTQLDAIVDAHNYLLNDGTDNIFKINLNNLKFTYAANGDYNFPSYEAAKSLGEGIDPTPEQAAALQAMQAYELSEGGKHLTLTVTLSSTRIVLITALLEDWDELIFPTLCDDFGQSGDPIIITGRADLLAFLQDDTKNKPGNTALISAEYFNLDTDSEDWPSGLDLRCTLNMAGAKLTTKHQFLNDITANGSILNGTIEMINETPVTTGICNNNYGTLLQVSVTSGNKQAEATKAGICSVNYGTITNCSSELKVSGTAGYVGGIAAESKYKPVAEGETAPIPTIDKCTVSGRVGTTATGSNTGAGGIVGYAEGRVSNNTFEYGMTLTQTTKDNHKNIVVASATDDTEGKLVDAYNNSWPTNTTNTIGKSNNPNAAMTQDLYQAVIDSQAELEILLNNHEQNAKYRIANDFEIDSTWEYGMCISQEKVNQSRTDADEEAFLSTLDEEEKRQYDNFKANRAPYVINFNLDGNNKTIATNGKMLFSYIDGGSINNLTIYCNESLEKETKASSTDCIAPLAYSVDGGILQNIKVKMAENKYIQASMASGMVIGAYGTTSSPAQITNCEVLVDVRIKLPEGFGSDGSAFAGGIAAYSSEAVFTGCQVHEGTKITEVSETQHNNLYFGGIVGGIATPAGHPNPSTKFLDCNVWIKDHAEWWPVSSTPTVNKGAIIGRYEYVTTGNKTQSGVPKGSEGNWWNTGFPLGKESKYEAIIGKKNSSTPSGDWYEDEE